MEVIDFPADDQCRVCIAFIKDLAQHGRGRRLAVGTGYGNALAPAHDVDQRIGAMDDRDAQAAGFDEFDVVVANGRGNDDDFGAGYVFCLLADEDAGSHLFEAFCRR